MGLTGAPAREHLHTVVKDNPQGVATAAPHPANAMPQVHAVEAFRAPHRAVTGGEDCGASFTGGEHLYLWLRTRSLLHEDKLATLPVASLPAKDDHHL